MRILNRCITKEELDNIYEDFKKIEKLDGLPEANRRRVEYICEDNNNKVIGYVSGLTNHQWFYLSDVWIHEEYRRKGLGTKLLFLLASELKTNGIKHIYT